VAQDPGLNSILIKNNKSDSDKTKEQEVSGVRGQEM
jgi:hypothetical protein